MPSDLPNLAIIGGAGAGKSTLADYLARTHGYTRLSFAGPLKDISVRLWGAHRGLSRERLQRLGVAVRDIDPDTWLDLFTTQLAGHEAMQLPTVVDDCRFPNEYEALKQRGFVFVRVQAGTADRVDRLTAIGRLDDPEQLMHESEQHQGSFAHDYSIYNSQGYQELAYTELEGVLDREARRT